MYKNTIRITNQEPTKRKVRVWLTKLSRLVRQLNIVWEQFLEPKKNLNRKTRLYTKHLLLQKQCTTKCQTHKHTEMLNKGFRLWTVLNIKPRRQLMINYHQYIIRISGNVNHHSNNGLMQVIIMESSSTHLSMAYEEMNLVDLIKQ